MVTIFKLGLIKEKSAPFNNGERFSSETGSIWMLAYWSSGSGAFFWTLGYENTCMLTGVSMIESIFERFSIGSIVGKPNALATCNAQFSSLICRIMSSTVVIAGVKSEAASV